MESDKTQPDKKAKAVIIRKQVIRALELRAIGFTFDQVAAAMDLPSRQRAHWLVKKGLKELAAQSLEKAEDVRNLHLLALARLKRKLEPTSSEPSTVHVLLRVMEREAKLLGLDSPVKHELAGAVQVEQSDTGPDLTRLTDGELEELERLHAKMRG